MQSSKIKSYFLLSILNICFGSLTAQNGNGFSIEGTTHFGKIIKHHDFLRYDVPDQSLGLDLNFTFQTYGKQDWNELHNYPMFGVALYYYDFGDSEVLGNAVSISPNLTIYLARTPKLIVEYQLGMGPAYLNKPYDRLENPDNNAIGSHFNINLNFRFGVKWQLNPHWQLGTGFSFTHFSNAAAEVPNYGVNIPALILTTRYTPKPLKEEDYFKHGTGNRSDKRFGVNLHVGAALKEVSAVGGPAYPVYSMTGAGMYYLNKTNRASLGLEFEINKAAYAFGHHIFGFESEAEARRRSNRFMLFVADEFLFGHIGLMIQMGIYLSKEPVLTDYPVYNKWGFHYHFSEIGKSNIRLYVGTQIKTHIYIADYISLDFGATF